MKGRLGLVAAVSLIAGCSSTVGNVPYEAYGLEEARCASVRQFTPLHERGTRDDPNADPRSACRAFPDRGEASRFGIAGPLYPLRAFLDAADTD